MTLFGDRVAVTEISEEITGELVLPQNVKTTGNYELGKVQQASPNSLQIVAVGDIVLFQIPNMVKTSTTYRFDKESKVAVIHKGDIIGILRKPHVDIENFEIAGNWMLLSIKIGNPFGIKTDLVLPDNAKPNLEDIHWNIVQLGRGCTDLPEGIKVGDQVIIERTRVNPITLGNTEYGFVDKSYIYGKFEEILTFYRPEKKDPKAGGLIGA